MSKLSIYRDETLGRFIKSKPNYPWDFESLSNHPNLTIRTIEMFPAEKWNWRRIALTNSNFTWEWVKTLPSKQWPWDEFPFEKSFVWRWVYELPESPWDWRALSHKITSPHQISYFREKPWDWSVLTLNEMTSINFMIYHADLPWVINELFFTLVNEPTVCFLRQFRDRYTPVDWIDHTKRATWSVIKKNMDLPWNFGSIQWKPDDLNLGDIDFLLTNQDILDMKKISETIDYHGIIKINQGNIKWDLEGISMNPGFSIRELPEKFEGYNLNLVRILDESDYWFAAQVIQKHWKRAITDPSRKMCRDVFIKDMFIITDTHLLGFRN